MAGSEVVVMQNATAFNATDLNGTPIAMAEESGIVFWCTNASYNGTLIIEATMDNVSWVPIAVYDTLNGVLAAALASIATLKIYFVPTLAGMTVRARMSAGSAGTLTVKARRVGHPLWGIRGA